MSKQPTTQKLSVGLLIIIYNGLMRPTRFSAFLDGGWPNIHRAALAVGLWLGATLILIGVILLLLLSLSPISLILASILAPTIAMMPAGMAIMISRNTHSVRTNTIFWLLRCQLAVAPPMGLLLLFGTSNLPLFAPWMPVFVIGFLWLIGLWTGDILTIMVSEPSARDEAAGVRWFVGGAALVLGGLIWWLAVTNPSNIGLLLMTNLPDIGLLVPILIGLSTGVLRPLNWLWAAPLSLALALAGRLSVPPERLQHWHPVILDELCLLPLPGLRYFLRTLCRHDPLTTMVYLLMISSRPVQWRSARLVFLDYLSTHTDPLKLLYHLLSIVTWGESNLTEIYNHQFNYIPSLRRLICPLSDRRVTPLTRFAEMLSDLLTQQDVIAYDEQPFDLKQYQDVYCAVGTYPNGWEITRSYEAMAALLHCNSLPELKDVGGWAPDLPNRDMQPAIRPAVVAILKRLYVVSREVESYYDSSSRANKQAALLRATDALQHLDQSVLDDVVAPEQYLLRRIIRQWQALIIAEGGVVGRAAQHGPVANPYILNNPAEGERFVGREDILRRLEELWGHAGQVPSVVIYGHRRMGKTSILHNLGQRFGAHTLIVDFNMQRVGRVSSDADLLYQMALHIYDECVAAGIVGLDEPAASDFSEQPFLGFTRFLRRLDGVRGERRVIITVDEFEKIEMQIEAGRLTPDLLDFWRGTFMTYSWLVLAFAGLYTLEERRHDYWSPLFGSVTGIKVSFLTPGAAQRLITKPSPDFALDYAPEAIDHIIALTNGQPFLIQMIGHTLVTRFNQQQTYEEGRERKRRFHLADVEAVINAPEFDRDGHAYFSGVWGQAEQSHPAGQTVLLRALAPHVDGLPLADLAAAAGMEREPARAALATLEQHDVVIQRDGRYAYTVELLRRWVLRQTREVMDEPHA